MTFNNYNHQLSKPNKLYHANQFHIYLIPNALIIDYLLAVIINYMLKQKQNLPSNLPIKPKSNYARQFDDFEKRLQKSVAIKLPSIAMRRRKMSLMDNMKVEEEYLQLAKKLMNKEKVNLCEQKENLFEMQQKSSLQELACMKNKIVKLKNRWSHQQTESQTTQISENISQYIPQMGCSKGLREPMPNNRSRALSNASISNNKQLHEGVNFLAYKKGKREICPYSKYE